LPTEGEMRGRQTPVRPPVVPAAVMLPPPHGPGGPVLPSRAPWLPLVTAGDLRPRSEAPLRPVPLRRVRLGGEPRSLGAATPISATGRGPRAVSKGVTQGGSGSSCQSRCLPSPMP